MVKSAPPCGGADLNQALTMGPGGPCGPGGPGGPVIYKEEKVRFSEEGLGSWRGRDLPMTPEDQVAPGRPCLLWLR